MSDADSRLNDAADRAEAGADIIEQVANGGDAVEVPTASGPRPSLAKWFADRYAEFYAWAALILADCLEALGLAQAALAETVAAKVGAESAQAGAVAARDAALLSRGLWQTTAQGIGQGVAGTASLVAGSGGTNGTFALAFSGGTQVIAPKGYFVVAGGVVTQVVITYAGHYSAGTPALSFAASAGLSGASATAVMGANTDVGEYFSVPQSGSDDLLILYRHDTGPVATEVARYPSTALVSDLRQELSTSVYIGYPTTPLPTGAAVASTTSVFVFSTPVKENCYRIKAVRINAAAAGNITIASWTKSGDVFTRVSALVVAVPVTGDQIIDIDFAVSPDQYVGIVSSGVATYNIGQNLTTWYSGIYGASFTDATTTSQSIHVQFDIACFNRLDIIDATVADNANRLTAPSYIGYPATPIPDPASLAVSGVYVFSTPAPSGVTAIKKIKLYAKASGDLPITTWTKSGDVFTRTSRSIVNVPSTGYLEIDVDIIVLQGEYIGFYTSSSIVGFNASPAGLTSWYSGGNDASLTFTDAAASTLPMMLQFEIAVKDRISKIETRLTSAESQLSGRFGGKKIYCFGDSITAGTEGGYVGYLESIIGATITNYGSSGADTRRLVGIITDQPARDDTGNYTDPDFTDIASVTIMIGTNNGVSGTIADVPSYSIQQIPYTTPSDVTVTTVSDHWATFPNTFYGNLALCIEYIRWKNDKTKVFLISPPNSDLTYANPNIGSAMKEIANLYSVEFLDAKNECGVSRKDLSRYSDDGTHMNLLGNELLGTYIAYKIKNS